MTDACQIHARWLVPIVPRGQVLDHHTVVIEDGEIRDLLPTAAAKTRYADLPAIDLPHHLLTAGLINTHGHAAMALLRGYADDKPLMDWLNNHIWPAESELVDYNFAYDGTTLAAAEMIAGGTTCAADTYFFPDAVARAFSDQGMRAQVAFPVIQFPNAWARDEDEHISRALDLFDQLKGSRLITTAFAPHAPYTVTDRGFERVVMFANELDIPVHLHLHETADEVIGGFEANQRRPQQRMIDLGVFGTQLQTVHMTQLLDDEIKELVANNVHVVHCPESNMKLASGTCPVDALLRAGVNVALGTDSAASNNNLDMLEEARTAALLAKLSTLDATSVDAMTALEMATINGARLLGLEQRIGSVTVGKAADLMAVDFSGFPSQPVHNPISQLIYTASAHQVSHTWVAGELLYRDHEYTRLDALRLQRNVADWQQRIQSL